MKQSSKFFLVLLICFGGTLSGCGETGLKGLSTLKGKITFKGEPIGDINITLIPVDPTKSRAAGAKSKADGTFTVTTLKPGDGIFPGEYKVVLAKQVFNMTVEESEAIKAAGKEPTVYSVNVMPKKYQKQSDTPLSVTVKSGQNEEFLIDVSEDLIVPNFSRSAPAKGSSK